VTPDTHWTAGPRPDWRLTAPALLRPVRHRRRPLLLWAGLLLVLALLLAGVAARFARRPPSPPPEAVGIWSVSREQLHRVNAQAPEGLLYLGPWPFRFDGETVYLHMFRLHAWEDGPEDDVYRLKARWDGNHLFYLHPTGQWKHLATFVDRHFEVRQSGVVWRMEKVDETELTELLRPFLKEGRPVGHSRN
jgi:hypothetical protein